MPFLTDTTLREGEQAAGVYLGPRQRQRIIAGLAAAGADEIELGPAGREDLAPLAAQVRRWAPDARLVVWARARDEDLAQAAAARPDLVMTSIPASDRHLRGRLGRDRAWALDRVAALPAQVRAACGPATRIGIGLEDATAADPAQLCALAAAAGAAGVDRLRLADTCGIATPGQITALVAALRPRFAGQLTLHAHDDFGCAMGNVLAAWEAGADGADGSLLGLGERAGIARSEALLAWMAVRGHQGSRYRLDGLAALCRLVARAAGRGVDPAAPVVGGRIFACETGIHVHGLLRDPTAYEPFPPELVGARRELRLGAKSGRAAVAAAASRLGLRLASAPLAGAVAQVRRRARRLHRPLREAEVIAALQAG